MGSDIKEGMAAMRSMMTKSRCTKEQLKNRRKLSSSGIGEVGKRTELYTVQRRKDSLKDRWQLK